MALLKKDKVKPVIRSVPRPGSENNLLRPYHLQKAAPCMDACPQGTNIRHFLMTIAQAQKYKRPQQDAFAEAWHGITERNPFPAVCGYVCPHPCEAACNRKEKDGALQINRIERFLGDWALAEGLDLRRMGKTAGELDVYSEKVAVIGATPAGLSFACHLARRGYPVTIFEAAAEPGGFWRNGVSSDRLPRTVLGGEIGRILKLGVELRTGMAVGNEISYEQLHSEFAGVYEAGDAANLWQATMAISQGCKAAESMICQLRGSEFPSAVKPPMINNDRMMLAWYPEAPPRRLDAPIPPESELIAEAQRCMSCGACFDCGSCWSYCQDQAVLKPAVPNEPYRFKLEHCIGCSKCKDNCPSGFIEMR